MIIFPREHPKSAELNITYRCDLACQACNRACFAPGDWRAQDMTAKHLLQFIEECKDFDQIRTIFVVGGEPTLHPEFAGFLRHLRELCELRFGLGVVVFSNVHSQTAKVALQNILPTDCVNVYTGTAKPFGSVATHPRRTIFLDPMDFGLARTAPCEWHSWGGCGIGVDSLGYTICPSGGMICDVLGIDARSQHLGDMFNPEIVQAQTDALCSHCGAFMDEIYAEAISPTDPNIRWIGWTMVSKTWQEGFQRSRK